MIPPEAQRSIESNTHTPSSCLLHLRWEQANPHFLVAAWFGCFYHLRTDTRLLWYLEELVHVGIRFALYDCSSLRGKEQTEIIPLLCNSRHTLVPIVEHVCILCPEQPSQDMIRRMSTNFVVCFCRAERRPVVGQTRFESTTCARIVTRNSRD